MGSRRATLLLPLLLAAWACSSGRGDKIGTLAGVVVEAEPTVLLFPATPMGESAARTVALRHSGSDGTLHLGAIRVIEDTPEFTVESPENKLLAPGGETSFTVVFEPVDDEPDVVHVAILHDSPVVESPLVIEVRSGAPNQALVALPFELDFGDVVAGQEPELGVRFLNQGTRVVHVASVALFRNSSPDFALTTDAAELGLPADVAPGQWLDARVRYRPTGGDAVDVGLLQVVSTETTLEASVDVRGRELAPNLKVTPATLDFGTIFLRSSAEAALTLENVGDVPLTLGDVSVVEAQTPWITLVDAPTVGTEIAPGQQLVVLVRFSPQASFEATAEALARVRIASDDPDSPFVQVPVRGDVRLPRVLASPAPLDFGRVAPGDVRTRELLLLNNSRPRDDVTVLSATLTTPTGEYALGPLPGFGPLDSPPASAVLAAGDAIVLPVTFTNQGGPDGDVVEGSITLVWDLDDEPPAVVPLTAERAAGRDCLPVLEPDLVDFGVVPPGSAATRLMALVNRGSGTCLVEAIELSACEPGATGVCDALPDASLPFTVDDVATLPGREVAAGQVLPFTVGFEPPTNGLDDGSWVAFSALTALTVASVDPPGSPRIVPSPPAAPNLAGSTGPACLVVTPDRVSFGDVRVGCSSPLRPVHAHNTCATPLRVTALDLVGCDAEFRLVNEPYLPAVLTQQNQMNLKLLTYAPEDLGPDGCALRVRTDEPGDPAYLVSLDGNGSLESHVRETFSQTGDRAVDILFVVDNSGSMIDNQQNLAANFGSLVAIATAWASDFHLGLVTTDMTPWGGQGHLVGDPPYLTHDDWQLFADHVKVGANGAGVEQGLWAAETALTWPLAADEGLPCQTDAACTAPLTCVDGGCGGPNRGFLRPEAVLHLVFVTDEDDQSPNDAAYYTDRLTALKGADHTHLVQAHAVVGLPATTVPGSTCASQAGQRYIDLANATGGVVTDICDKDWAAKLEALGNAIFGLVKEFPLVRTPDPATLTVQVAGKLCDAGWTLDTGTNRLVFDPDGPCMPEHGDEIVVDYDVYCYRY